MELKLKQELLKVAKQIKNGSTKYDAKLPGYLDGTPSGTNVIGWSNENGPIFEQSLYESLRNIPTFVHSPAVATKTSHLNEMLESAKNNPAALEKFKDTIAGPIYTGDDPYALNKNLTPPDPKLSPAAVEPNPLINKVGKAAVALPEAIGQVSQSFAYDDRDKIYNSARNVLRTRSGIGYTAKELPAAKNGKLPGYARGTLDSTLSTAAAGASVGSAFGPWGTAIGGAVGGLTGLIGGLWSNSKEARERAAAQERIGEENYAGALTADAIAMRQENALDYGLTKQGRLRGMKCGKLPGFVGGKRVETIDGLEYLPQTAWGSNGEGMYQITEDGIKFNVIGDPKHPDNKDTVPINDKGAGILSNEDMDYLRKTGDLPGAIIRSQKRLSGFKCGKLPKHYDGKWANVGAHLMSGVGGLSQYLQALNDKPYNPNTYAGNPYEGKALNDLYSLRANPYPILPSIYDAQAKGMYAINNSGGLSGGQRTLARLAATKNTQDSISKMLLASQEQNNQYLAQAANASLNAGQAAAQRRMQANQFDLDYYSKAHAARQQGMQLGMYNMINSYQSYLKNLDKYNQFARMYSLYSDDLDIRRDAVKRGGVNV